MGYQQIIKIEQRPALKNNFQKAGGNLGTLGSASHNFIQLGIIKIDKKEVSDDQIFELATNAGADECKNQKMISTKYNVLLVKFIMLRKN